MIIENAMTPTKKLPENPSGFELLEAAGCVKKLSSGFYALMPNGMRVIQKMEGLLREIAEELGFGEVSLPQLQDINLWRGSGRFEQYRDGLFTVNEPGREEARFLIAPTSEEVIIDLHDKLSIPDDKPWRVFKIGDCARNELRPAFGLVRAKSFRLAEFYTIVGDRIHLGNVLAAHETIIRKAASGWGISYDVARYPEAGNFKESFWTESDSKQSTTYYCEDCGKRFRSNHRRMLTCSECYSKNILICSGAEIGDLAVIDSHTIEALGERKLVFTGIGITRSLQLIAEQNHDKKGIVWPKRIAPYDTYIIANSARRDEARTFYSSLNRRGKGDAILDLRNVSVGEKLVDADLVGCPTRVVFGNKTGPGMVEAKSRNEEKVRKMNI